MNATLVTTRCNACGTSLQISPGGNRLCACGSLVTAPLSASSAPELMTVAQPTTRLPWPFLLPVVGIVLAGVAVALATMDQGGAVYTLLVTGLLLLVVVVTFAVIREMHKPLDEEAEEELLGSSAFFVQALRQTAVANETQPRGERPVNAGQATDTQRKVPLPFDAYQGTEPFLFASYSHQDAAQVYPDIARLNHLGYRIWYDEGICPGREWPEAVADALKQAAFFVVFISPRALASYNVRNEINLALKKKKPFLAIHLEETDLPGGVELQIGSLQAILKHRVDEERYCRRLEISLPAELRKA